jgi:hypothetical protein
VTSGTLTSGYRHFVAIYRCDVTTTAPFVAVCGGVKVELFREERSYIPSAHHNLVIAAVKDAEYCSPALPPIRLDARSLHLVLTARTRASKSESQEEVERAIDGVVNIVSALYSLDLFRIRLYRGWLQGPPSPDLGVLARAVLPINIDGTHLRRDYDRCSHSIAGNGVLRDRFSLMSSFVSRGVAEPPSEEAYVWLWTALEVFPMVNTTDIKPISEFLASYIGQPAEIVKEKLRIGWLFGMRSKIIHDGHLPLANNEHFSALNNLESVVRAVVRHASCLPYDGAFDYAFQKS